MILIHSLLNYFTMCYSDGSLRVDATVFIRRPDSTSLGTRTEIKNVSGFRALNRAINEY